MFAHFNCYFICSRKVTQITMKKTIFNLFISLVACLLSILIISLLFDQKLWFSFYLDFKELGNYFDMTLSLWKTIFTDWIFLGVLCIWAIITFLKKKNIEEAIHFTILGFHSDIIIKIAWMLIACGSIACVINYWVCTLIAWFTALIIPYVVFITTYSFLQKKQFF